MPVVTIKIAKGRTTDQKRKLARAVTDALVATLDIRPESVTVVIEEFGRENWATGGELHIDKYGRQIGVFDSDR